MAVKHKIKKKLAGIGILATIIILINLLFDLSGAVRQFYFHRGYPIIGSLLRALLGWIPISIGDILYLLLMLWIIFFGIRLVKAFLAFRSDKKQPLVLFLKALFAILLIYLVFMVSWGFNYRGNRLKKSFGLSQQHYSKGELIQLCGLLAVHTNRSHIALTGQAEDSTRVQFIPSQLFREVERNYHRAAAVYPGLVYHYPSIKPSMFGDLMNYIGVSGYYNPLTGEAQVNTTIPPFMLPFVTCHEIAHQLGFAAEYDANFIGWVVAASSPDARFRYAANFEMLVYALGELRFKDSTAAKTIWNQVDPGVKKDYHVLRRFYDQFRNPVDPLMSDMYDRYLKANRQEMGIHSYNEVVGLLIDYFRKNTTDPGVPGRATDHSSVFSPNFP